MTDELTAYKTLTDKYAHQFVNHTVQYVNGIVHTNGLENFWALFKRCVKGTHISIEACHLFRYLDAEMFRYNLRKLTDGERLIHAVTGMSGKRLTYKGLINTPEMEYFAAGSVNASAEARDIKPNPAGGDC